MATTKKTTTAVKADNKVTIKFEVELQGAIADEAIYLVGNTKELGNWDVTKAKALKKNKNGIYASAGIKFEKGTVVEFKICKGQSWDTVEKTVEGADLPNHAFTANEDQPFTVVVYRFN
jgi:hypothetical protein